MRMRPSRVVYGGENCFVKVGRQNRLYTEIRDSAHSSISLRIGLIRLTAMMCCPRTSPISPLPCAFQAIVLDNGRAAHLACHPYCPDWALHHAPRGRPALPHVCPSRQSGVAGSFRHPRRHSPSANKRAKLLSRRIAWPSSVQGQGGIAWPSYRAVGPD